MFFLKIIESFERHNIDYTVSGAYAAALHGYVQNISQIEFVVENSKQGLANLDMAMSDCGLSFVEKKSGNLHFENLKNPREKVVIHAGLNVDDCKSVIKPVFTYKVPVMTLHELQKKLEFQIQNRQLLSQKAFLLKPTEILQILEDYRNLNENSAPAAKDKSILISMKIPESLLEEFREACESQDVKYQTQIKKLMKDWLT